MADFSLDDDMDIIVKARLVARHEHTNVDVANFTVKLYDNDMFDDDFLGESECDEDGNVSFTIDNTSFGDLGKLEQRPDFYFVVYNEEQAEVFRSKVMEDVDILSTQSLFKMGQGNVIDLGAFLLDL